MSQIFLKSFNPADNGFSNRTANGQGDLVRAAQERGELPLGAVQREEQKTRPQTSTQVSLSPLSQLKEMLRQRVSELYSRSEALVQRIARSGPEQIEALSKELKRLSLELKRLVSQYKALKGMEQIQGTQLSAGSPISNLDLQVFQRVQGVSLEAESVRQIEPLDTTPTVAVDASAEQSVETELDQFESETLEKLKQEALELYKKLAGQDNDQRDGQGDKQGNQQGTSADGEEDNLPGIFKEILKKLKEARELLELKAGLANDTNSASMLTEIEAIQIELEAELAEM